MTTATQHARRRHVPARRAVSSEMLLLEFHLPRKGGVDPGSAGLLLGLLAGSAAFWIAVGWVAAALVR